MAYPDLWNAFCALKAVFREKFVALSAFIITLLELSDVVLSCSYEISLFFNEVSTPKNGMYHVLKLRVQLIKYKPREQYKESIF